MFQWFIAQANTNCEKMAKRNLEDRIKRFGLEEHFGDIVVPSQEVVEMKSGQKKKVERKIFPNYVFVHIKTEDGYMSSEAWHAVRETPKISGFIGGTQERPLPISDAEAERMLGYMVKNDETQAEVVLDLFRKGQTVRVIDGPFADFHGVVEENDPQHGKVKVSVLVFGRPTPVDFQNNQVELADA